MSTTPPQHDAPQDPARWEVEPWNVPPTSWAATVRHRAARWVWVLAGVEIALTLCCSMLLLALAVVPPGELEKAMTESGADQNQVRQVLQMTTYAPALAAGYGVMGVVPALVLAASAFGVRRGRNWAVALCLVIVLMQMLVIGAFLLMGIAVALSSGRPGQFTFAVLVLGSLIALMGFTFRHLLEARRAGAASHDEDANPWSESSHG
jgi:uncharacterized membrane protein